MSSIDFNNIDDIVEYDPTYDEGNMSIEIEDELPITVSAVEDVNSANDTTVDQTLKTLLESWNMPTFYPILMANGITVEDLKVMEDPYYLSLIKNGEESLGKLLRFRSRHIEWKKGTCTSSRQGKKNRKMADVPEPSAEDILTDEMRLSIDYVNDIENHEAAFDELFKHWEVTYPYRKAKHYTAEDALNEWPVLQASDGFVMILIDFQLEYKRDIADGLKDKWDNFIFDNLGAIVNDIKNPKTRKALLSSQTETDVNIRDRRIFISLHSVTFLVPKRVSTKKKTWTPAIACSENAFLWVVKKKEDIAGAMKCRKTTCDLHDIAYHPMIFECNTRDGPKYFIGICDVVYECDSLIHAVDASFKIFAMFKIPFPPECKRVWIFINEIFYKIKLQPEATEIIVSNLEAYKL